MSQSILDVNDKFFVEDLSDGSGPPRNTDVPNSLQRATLRLNFPPSYVVVGAYRLLSDKALIIPIWRKCRNGFLKGAAVGCAWVCDWASQVSIQRPDVLMHVVISNLFDSAQAYQDLLVKVRESAHRTPCVSTHRSTPAPQMFLAMRTTQF
jgi:hypothetical protein